MRQGLALLAGLALALALAGTAVGGGRATAVYTYQPFGANGLKASIKVTETVKGECFTGSIASRRNDAWRCTAGNEILDPCFSGTQGFVVCPEYFSTRQVTKLELSQPLPAEGNTGLPTAQKGLPWALIALPYAHQCRAVTGMLGEYEGKPIYYNCVQGMLVGKLNRSSPRWTAKFLSEGDNPTLYTLAVRGAWY